MDILADIYQSILNSAPPAPPEIGGILGGYGDVICKCQIDMGLHSGCGCFYTPNVTLLNDTIKKWQSDGIAFYGIFHTHFFGVQTLSDGDISYINVILTAMPSSIRQLYFPIVVLPEKQIVPYLAVRNGGMIEIKKDVLHIV